MQATARAAGKRLHPVQRIAAEKCPRSDHAMEHDEVRIPRTEIVAQEFGLDL